MSEKKKTTYRQACRVCEQTTFCSSVCNTAHGEIWHQLCSAWRASGPPSAEHWTDRPSSTLQVDPPTLHRCLGISRALRRGRKMQLEFIIMCQHKLNMHACGDWTVLNEQSASLNSNIRLSYCTTKCCIGSGHPLTSPVETSEALLAGRISIQ